MSSQYNPENIESKWYDYWLEHKVFRSEPNKKKSYTIVMPPPNVTGVLHMGHMLNNTIQDVLVRRARLLGLNACWVPGTDHASIATEAKVISKLKEQKIQKSDLSRQEFLKHAWLWTDEHGGIILNQLKRLGSSCDWERVKFTMDKSMSESVVSVFVDLYNQGLIYKDVKMINWDPQAQTAVSDEEVIHKEQSSKLYYIDYLVVNSKESITVATTRPETILGDTAICVHPQDERYLKLVGQKVFVPLINREIPIISDTYIDQEFGTGALKVTPAHDINDYEIGKKNNLEIISVIDKNGCMNNSAQLYIGEDRFLVRDKIVLDIQKVGQLNKIEIIQNKVGFSERTNAVIEPRLSQQWFMKMNKLAKPALNNVLNQNIKFHPLKFQNVYKHWMDNIRDWCLSRQLWWGHRIPAFYYDDENYVVAKNKEEALILANEKIGNIELADLKQDDDVLDTWFSSWIWPISVFDGIRNPENTDFQYYYPTNDLVTGHDILFFWVARMIMAGYTTVDNLPFKNVYFTGMVRDKERKKMSKSLGNSPDPITLIDKYGADGVRSGMLFSSPAGNDLLFDEKLCQQGRNFANKIWNAYRLIESWSVSGKSLKNVNVDVICWFENKLQQDVLKINKLFNEFKISESLMVIYKLIWHDFCSSYLEIIKPFDKNIDAETHSKTIYFLESLLILLHPFMPFISEEIWQQLSSRKDGQTISYCAWPTFNNTKVDTEVLNRFQDLFKLIAAIRKIRKDKNIAFKEKIDLLCENKSFISFESILQKTCNIDKIDVYIGQDNSLFPFLVNKNRFFIPLVFHVDPEKEINRINKEINYLKGFLESIEHKLSNTNFIMNAPQNVIEVEKQKQNDTIIKIESLIKELKTFNESR